MKKIILLLTILSSVTLLFGFGVDDAKKTKIIASITQTITKQEDAEAFSTCVTTTDPTVASILSDTEKRQHLNDLPLKDIQNIEKVTNSCDTSKK